MSKTSTAQNLLAASLAAAVLGTACGDLPASDDSTGDGVPSGLIGGTTTNARPEIGVVSGPVGSCSGTLVAARWVLTAAHCVGFSTARPGAYSFFVGNPNANPAGQIISSAPVSYVKQIFNFGPTGWDGSNIDDWARTHLHKTTDLSGNDDVALLLLTNPVSIAYVQTPASIANALPADGAPTTDFGYGCKDFVTQASDGLKRFATWTYGTHSSATTSTNGFLVNSDGQLVSAGSGPSNAFSTGGHVCPGDSGGPVMTGAVGDGGDLWGVNSSGTGPSLGLDTFGAVAFLRKPICRAAYSKEPHNPCQLGAPLIVPPGGCASSQTPDQELTHTDSGIRAVCGVDPYCCDPNGGRWDSQCVQEMKNFTGTPQGC